jgi:oxygen-independent coproporphyrinogen-3 oxidase
MIPADPGLLARLGQLRVPRYTSYPTAPHFTAEIDGARYRAWLRSLSPDSTASLYLHVPFCPALCWYCGCTTKAPRHRGPIDRYVGLMAREIEMVADTIPSRLRVRHIHWGGGTPTVLTREQLQSIMSLLRARFDVAPDAEIAIEIDPRNLGDETAETLGGLGFNRASLGVQSFDRAVQTAVNRRQTVAQTKEAAARLRAAGLGRINVDLLYGLPLETSRSALATALHVLTMTPSRLAVFGYAHVPAIKPHQRHIQEQDLPGVAARADQAAIIDATLQSAGYVPVGIDHYAQADDDLAAARDNGTLRRNFQGYTTDRADCLIGFGVSAIGSLTQGYAQNTAALSTYESVVAGGRLPIARGRSLSAEDRVRADIIERLMCYLEADLDAIAERHGRHHGFAEERDALEELARQGIVTLDGSRIVVPEACRGLARVVASAFDAYLVPTERRHAVAI